MTTVASVADGDGVRITMISATLSNRYSTEARQCVHRDAAVMATCEPDVYLLLQLVA